MTGNNDIAFWIDQQAIRALIDRYTDGVNRQDWNAVASTFAETAIWETSGGPFELRFEGREAVIGFLQSALGNFEFMVQSNGAVAIEVEGERARARVSLTEIARDKSGNGMHNIGIYFDDLAKTDGQWRFVRRAFRCRYSAQPALPGAVFVLTPPPAL